MCVLACRLEWKWSQDKSTRKVFTGGGALERVQIFILPEGLKIEFFGIIRYKKQFSTNFL